MKTKYLFIPFALLVIFFSLSYYLSQQIITRFDEYIQTEISCDLDKIQEQRHGNIIISQTDTVQNYLFAIYGGLESTQWEISEKLQTICKNTNKEDLSITLETPIYLIPKFYKIKLSNSQNNTTTYLDLQIIDNKINIVGLSN